MHQRVCVYVFECAGDGRMPIPELLVPSLMCWRGTYVMEHLRVSLCRSKYMVGLGCVIGSDGR